MCEKKYDGDCVRSGHQFMEFLPPSVDAQICYFTTGLMPQQLQITHLFNKTSWEYMLSKSIRPLSPSIYAHTYFILPIILY